MILRSVFLSFLLISSVAADASASAAAEDLTCPAGSVKKGEKPLLVVSGNDSMTIFVCGRKEPEGKTKIHSSDFEVFAKDGNGKIKNLGREKSHEYRIWSEDKKILVQEVTWFSGGWAPVLQWDIACNEKTCVRSATSCAFNKDVAIKHQAQRELKDTKNWENPTSTPEPSLLDSVKDSALTGSPEAQKFFLQPDKNRHFTKDGQKQYLESQTLLKRLMEYKCL